ncbi:MAG: hypothetical protein SGARI_004593 [Bacillariaceae sp.]
MGCSGTAIEVESSAELVLSSAPEVMLSTSWYFSSPNATSSEDETAAPSLVVQNQASATIDNAIFNGTSDSSLQGGCIYNEGTVHVSNSKLTQIPASTDQSNPTGAIYSNEETVLTMANTTIYLRETSSNAVVLNAGASLNIESSYIYGVQTAVNNSIVLFGEGDWTVTGCGNMGNAFPPQDGSLGYLWSSCSSTPNNDDKWSAGAIVGLVVGVVVIVVFLALAVAFLCRRKKKECPQESALPR